MIFLDRCDICHKPKKCRGYNGKVICEECINDIENTVDGNHLKKIEVNKTKKGQISIYDLM